MERYIGLPTTTIVIVFINKYKVQLAHIYKANIVLVEQPSKQMTYLKIL